MRYSIPIWITHLYIGFSIYQILWGSLCCCFGGDLSHSDTLQIPNAQSAYAPSAVEFNGNIYLGWRGAGTLDGKVDDQQLYLSKFSQEHWSDPRKLPGKSMFGPVLASSNDRLFIAWHGPGNIYTGTGDYFLYLAYINKDGDLHEMGRVPGAASAGPPGIAVYNDLVYIGWRSVGNITIGFVPGNQHWIQHNVYDPQTGEWADSKGAGINIVHANSASGPTFTVAHGALQVLWRGSGSVSFYSPNSEPGDPYIYYGSFDGEDWSTTQLPLPTIPNALTAWGPGAIEWQGDLWVGWRGDQAQKGNPEDTTLYFAKMHSDAHWESVDLFDDPKPQSAFLPAMASDQDGNRLWFFWRGPFNQFTGEDDQRIYAANLFKKK